MTSMTLAAILQASLLTQGATYAEAHKQNTEDGRPLVVLIGADWCPACVQMKESAMPQVERRGLLKRVAFAMINTDHEGPLARQMMRGGSIPQLIMYRKTEEGWKRHSLVGAQSPQQIESFINQGLQAPVLPASTAAAAKAQEAAKTAAKPAANSGAGGR